MRVLALNHVGLHVDDVERSVVFYGEILGLATLPRPEFSFPGAWFALGPGQELHLIGGRGGGNAPDTYHYSLEVEDLDGILQRLRQYTLEYRGPQIRPDEARQVFLRDPDGHTIELLEPAS